MKTTKRSLIRRFLFTRKDCYSESEVSNGNKNN